MKKLFSFIVALFLLLCGTAQADEVIGTAKSSGFIFKDTISVIAVPDPDYPSVICYTTEVEIGGPNPENPTDSSIACRLVAPFRGKPESRRGIFTKAKNFFAKRLVVDRFYDKKRNVLVYLSYTKKLIGKNASHAVSVVPLGMPLAPDLK